MDNKQFPERDEEEIIPEELTSFPQTRNRRKPGIPPSPKT